MGFEFRDCSAAHVLVVIVLQRSALGNAGGNRIGMMIVGNKKSFDVMKNLNVRGKSMKRRLSVSTLKIAELGRRSKSGSASKQRRSNFR